jgi:D-alanyl-lipoteichoic acid acyltransferase DltB (MBOAT superfamily)
MERKTEESLVPQNFTTVDNCVRREWVVARSGWTFIVWGMLNGFYLGMEPTIQKKWLFLEQWKNRSRILDLIIVTAQRLVVFVLFGFSMVFFRAKTLQEAWQIVTKIFIPHSGGFLRGSRRVPLLPSQHQCAVVYGFI